MEKSSEGANAEVQMYDQVQAGLQRIENLSFRFRHMKGTATSVLNGMDRLRGDLDELDEDLDRELKALEELLK